MTKAEHIARELTDPSIVLKGKGRRELERVAEERGVDFFALCSACIALDARKRNPSRLYLDQAGNTRLAGEPVRDERPRRQAGQRRVQSDDGQGDLFA